MPIGPLYFVKRESGDAKQVFASDALEAFHVLEHFDTLLVAAREYEYTREDLDGVGRGLSQVLAKKVGAGWTPHKLWHRAIMKRPKDCQCTYFERALAKYQAIIQGLRKK